MGSISVLVVDDEGQFVDPLVERLNLRGFRAEGVGNGHDALKRLHETSFDVVLLDVKMPGLGGLEVIKKVKEKFPNLRVILLTGHGSTQDAEEGLELGAFRYLMKPVNIDDLIVVLQAAPEQK